MIKNRLFTPGPTDVPPEVLVEMARPIFHHRTPRFKQLLGEVHDGVRKVLKSSGDIITIAGSGTAGMEAAIACLVPRDKKVLVANNGKFGERWVKVARLYSLDVDEAVLEWGTAISPAAVKAKLASGDYGAVIVVHSETSTATACDLEAIGKEVAATDAILLADCITSAGALPLEADAWGVDVIGIGSQKAMMCPPGLATLAVSEKAWQAGENVKSPGMYLNLKAYRKSAAENDTPYTPAVTMIRGMKVALDMINAVGIDRVTARTAILAKACRTAAEAIGMKVFSKRPSDSVSGLLYPDGIDDAFRKAIEKKYGCSLAGGQDQLKGKLCRVSHMGFVDPLDTVGLIAAMEYTLADLGAKVEIGSGVAAAARILRGWE
jgi:aspartate aminotransferase-like enzyme